LGWTFQPLGTLKVAPEGRVYWTEGFRTVEGWSARPGGTRVKKGRAPKKIAERINDFLGIKDSLNIGLRQLQTAELVKSKPGFSSISQIHKCRIHFV
jgi:hypothetical protein